MTDDVLGTANEFMVEREGVLFVRRFAFGPALPQHTREIVESEKWVSGGVLSSSIRKDLVDEKWMRHCLVGLQRCILS